MRSRSRRAALCAGVLGLPLAGTVAHGQTVTGDVTIVSDFRYRGVSLSDGRPAFQADATLLFATGFYGNLWTSTIAPYNGARQEVDLTAGRRFSFDGVAIDWHPQTALRVLIQYVVDLLSNFG